MEQMQQEQPMVQNFFKYEQKLNSSTSITSLTAHSLNIQLLPGVYGKNDNFNILIYNGVAIPEVAGIANTVLSRAVIIGDKRALSTTKIVFSNITFISDQINMQSSTITQHVHNQLYFYDKQVKTADSQKLYFGNDVAASFVQNLDFDPLVYHHFGNKAYSDAIGTIQADTVYKVAAAADALGAIAINTFFTTISIPFYQLLPGLFELQDKIYLTNASLTLQIDNDYQIDAYVQTRGYLANGVQTVDRYTQTFFKFVPNQQIYIQSVQNVSTELSYQIPFKYRILQAQGDLKSETIKLQASNVKFLSFMIVRKNLTLNLSNGKIMQNLFELNNDANKVILNNLSFSSGRNFLYVQPNIATMRQPCQQKAFENISGIRLGFPHLSFFSFEEIDQLEFNISINILEKTGADDYMYYIYYIVIE